MSDVSILRAYLVGPAASPNGGQAIVIVIEPNGDESRVTCLLKGSTTEIGFNDGHQAEYYHERYGGPNGVSSVIRRAALGLSRREDDDIPRPPGRLESADFLLQRTTEAFEFARRAHGGQVRKATHVPYLSHLMAVAALVLEYGGDEDETIAALLHDVPEDAGGDAALAEIERIFGERVTRIVEGCTETTDDPKPPWRDRKEQHIAHLVTADSSILLVLAADKLHNTGSVREELKERGNALWGKFKGGKDGTLWYLDTFADSILRHPECTGGVRRLAERLRASVNELMEAASALIDQ